MVSRVEGSLGSDLLVREEGARSHKLGLRGIRGG